MENNDKIKNFYPADEEITRSLGSVLFLVLWYGIIYVNMRGRVDRHSLIFYAAGIPIAITIIRSVSIAISLRRERKRVIARGYVRKGYIRSVQQVYGSGGGDRNRNSRKYYQYEVAFQDASVYQDGFSTAAYRVPLHLYLSSPEVNVYTDETGWKHYVQDFHVKHRMSDPGPFTDNRTDVQNVWTITSERFDIIYIIFIALILFISFFR